jgi:hypothetical protein
MTAALIAVLYISFSLHLPLTLFASASHDDALFWALAESIASGRWLGNYDQLTLAKGPAFSIVLALNSWLGTPITLTLALTQLGCASVLMRELRAWGMPPALAFLTWIVLLFQPACLPTRVVRDHFYQSLTLLILAALLHLVRSSPRGGRIAASALFGVAFGVFWMTREEGLWVFPGALCLLTWALWVQRRDRDALKALGARLATLTGAALFTMGAVSTVNLLKYGAFTVVDFKRTPFVSALKMLNGVQTPTTLDYVPVSREQRALAYEVSPAFRELQDYFERGGGLNWIDGSCGIAPQSCGEIAGGWFMWALRDAAASKGHFISPSHADSYFRQVADEINSACRDGRLTCASHNVPFLPRMTGGAWDRLGGSIRSAFLLTHYATVSVPSTEGLSQGPEGRFLAFRAFLGEPRTTPMVSTVQMVGWLVAPQDRWLEVVCKQGGQETVTPIPRRPSPDLVAGLPDPTATHNRFDIDLEIGRESQCALRLIGEPVSFLQTDGIRSDLYMELQSGGRFKVDIARRSADLGRAVRAKARLGEIFRVGTPWVMGAAALMLLVGAFRAIASRHGSPMLVMGATCWLLASTRVLLLAVIDATSFPGVIFYYLAPATQLWWVGALALLTHPFTPRHDPT